MTARTARIQQARVTTTGLQTCKRTCSPLINNFEPRAIQLQPPRVILRAKRCTVLVSPIGGRSYLVTHLPLFWHVCGSHFGHERFIARTLLVSLLDRRAQSTHWTQGWYDMAGYKSGVKFQMTGATAHTLVERAFSVFSPKDVDVGFPTFARPNMSVNRFVSSLNITASPLPLDKFKLVSTPSFFALPHTNCVTMCWKTVRIRGDRRYQKCPRFSLYKKPEWRVTNVGIQLPGQYLIP